VSNMPANYTLT